MSPSTGEPPNLMGSSGRSCPKGVSDLSCDHGRMLGELMKSDGRDARTKSATVAFLTPLTVAGDGSTDGPLALPFMA
jgi:hypothetical protein